MTRDELYRQYEGLAVLTGSRVFNAWRKSLQALGHTVEDAVQQAKLVLLELAPKLDDSAYNHAQQTCYVVKSIRGELKNWAERQIKNGLPDTRERPDSPQPDHDGLIDLQNAMAQLDPDVRRMVLARYGGATYDTIGKANGLSAGQAASRVKAALAILRKMMQA